MDLNQIGLFAAMKRRMEFASERQEVLARNVANANTPGYIPNDLQKVDFREAVKSQAGGVAMDTTHPGHMNPGTSKSGKFKQVESYHSSDVKPSGNAVVVEDQMIKMQHNAMDYQATTALYKKMTGLFEIAINGGR